MNAWHFVGDRLRDGRPIPADGETLIHEGGVCLCRSGLHAGERIIDALPFAPGTMLCHVRCEQIEQRSLHKIVCRRRTILWRMDIEELLRKFTRECALDVIDMTPSHDTTDIRAYLQSGDERLRKTAEEKAYAMNSTYSTYGEHDPVEMFACAALYDATTRCQDKEHVASLCNRTVHSVATANSYSKYEDEKDRYNTKLTRTVLEAMSCHL